MMRAVLGGDSARRAAKAATCRARAAAAGAAVALPLILSLGLPAAAAGYGWTEPVGLSAGQVAYSPDAVVDVDGSATAAWLTSAEGGAVWASHRPAGGAWRAPVRVSETGASAGSLRLAIDDAGSVTAVWQRAGGDVQAAQRPRGGAWSAPVDVASGASGPLVLDAGGDGGAVVGWEAAGGELQTAVRPPGASAWQPLETVPAAGSGRSWSGVAIDPAGNVTALWSGEDGEGYQRVYAASRSAADAWESPVALSREQGDALDGRVVVDGAGTVTAAWRWSSDVTVLEVEESHRTVDGDWSDPENLSQEGWQHVTALDLAANAAGDVAVVWRRSTDDHLRGRIRRAGGAWGMAREASSTPAASHDVAMEADGDAVIVWSEQAGAQSRVHAGHGRDDTWYGARAVATVDGAAYPGVAVDPAGEAATVVWDGAGTAWASARDVSAPDLRGLSVPSRVVGGEPVTFSVSPWDLLSPVTFTTWTIRRTAVSGDGSVSSELVAEYSGHRATHTFPIPTADRSPVRMPSGPSRYHVSVATTDTTGNRSSARRWLTVGAPPPVYAPMPRSVRLDARDRLPLRRLLRTGALPAVCRLSEAATCRVRADIPVKRARRLGIRGPKTAGRVVLGAGRVVASGPASPRVRVKLRAIPRRSLRRVHRRARRAAARARSQNAKPRARRLARRARRPIPIRLQATVLFQGARGSSEQTLRLVLK